MSLVSFQGSAYSNYSQPAVAVAFKGKGSNLSHLSKKVLDRREYVKQFNQAIPANKIISMNQWFKSIGQWFKKLF